ncbi:hypothetical protein A1O3_03241 [Capronia epimyces CBS 606.96]|uniref:15-hydroxyprostaglandin dehydrogenase (NAD) n=1 Tax=Capronia epimyces CBS 606.96 TaxID=1182542 RepID=W9YBD2_9EURO|nr:uncharacterized protein A1O3_03241 [Capronia epimyces CBS 606.96]EXJ90172.1 hypothetical protein A1O3_03241 [Capronia epimyces CBS 606.96]
MGLAVAESLSRSGWRVSIVDLNENDGQAAAQKVGGIFTKANVTVYEELAHAFGKTWKEYGRIDFVFANAGIVERASFYAKQEETADGLPPSPNMLASRVMFDGAIATVYLGLHFLRKNSPAGGSIIILASSAGIYPAPNGPLYTASKHGMVGLTRALASRLWAENIHISCICPGAVATGLMPAEAFQQMNQDTFTPLEKIASVVQSLLEREEVTSGAAVEVVGQKHYLRWRPEFCDETMEKCWDSFGGTSAIRDGGLTTNWKQ